MENLLRKGYPGIAGLAVPEFLEHVEPLETALDNLDLPDVDFGAGHLPFCVVVKSGFGFGSEDAMALAERNGRNGVTTLRPHRSQSFSTISDITVPGGMAYLLMGIDRGKGNINRPPSEAMQIITESNRSPLTIDEGIAIVTQFPEFLMKNNCFSLLASRTGTDQRVPAIWINAKKEPNLGWCWAGNPHTWLGSASAVSRVGLASAGSCSSS